MTLYRSFAKINLHLEVSGRRDDGYHELRTLFQTVSLCDLVEVELAGDGIDLAVSGHRVPDDSSNLAHRAAALWSESWGGGSRGVRLRLDKRIPVEGGLGGGSSNAATVLLALRELAGRPTDVGSLAEVAATLGADVPYFLHGGTALGVARGDRVEPLPDLDEEAVWLCVPDVGLSTARVFGRLGAPRRDHPHPKLTAVLEGRIRRPSEAVGVNDLEAAVFALSPPVERVYTALVQNQAEQVRVSGSGATVFAFGGGSWRGSGLESALPSGVTIHRARTLSRASIAALRVVGSRGGA